MFAYFYGEAASDPHMAEMHLRELASGRAGRRDGGPGRRHDRKELDATLVSEMSVAMADGLRLQGIFDPAIRSPRRQRQHVVEWLSYLTA